MAENRYPDGWTILKITTSEEMCYKIFSTWRWDNEEWILSSGTLNTEELTQEDTKYVWPQASGSIYHLPFNGEHCYTFYQGLVLEKIKTQSAALGATIEIISMDSIFKKH